jgi:cytochrome d ubiquinol oxidase subunit I
MPQSKLFLWIASAAGVLSIIAMEAGWIVTEVGRQPWIVYEIMRVEDAATGNEGVAFTFFGILVLYAVLGTATILVLRSMKNRFQAAEAREDEFTDHDVPYGPSTPTSASVPDTEDDA